jgi:hypothetical protein
MKKEMVIRAVAGTMVLISILLSLTVSPYWFSLAAFVGLDLLQSAFTHFCPLDILLTFMEKRNK